MSTEPTFGTGLKAARELAGLSLREVEAATGISNAYLCQLEGNKIRRPSVFFLTKLAALYGIDRDQLMASLPDMPPLTNPVKAAVWKWLPPPTNDEEQLEMVEYLKLIRARNRRALSNDTNRAGGKPSFTGPRCREWNEKIQPD